MIIVVLGCPRSGTSAITGFLHHLGIPMRDRKSTHEWEYDQYEDEDFATFADYILGKVVGPYISIQTEMDRFTRLIDDRIEKFGKLWGWKHPQTVWYIKWFHHLIPDPYYIYIKRNKKDALDSIERMREKYPEVTNANEGEAEIIYNTYEKKIDTFLSTFEPWCDIIQYEDLISEPERFANAFIGLLELPEENRDKAVRFIYEGTKR
jgi:hypothetical protein